MLANRIHCLSKAQPFGWTNHMYAFLGSVGPFCQTYRLQME